jgi:hypothetical protein
MAVKIYCIQDINGLKYVGSTNQYLSTRLCGHKRDKKRKHTISSSELDLDNCEIMTLELCDENTRKEREAYWIDKLNCVNYNKLTFNKNKFMKQYNKSARGREVREKFEQTPKRKQYNKNYNKQYKKYRSTWGGDIRYNNNLLLIDVNLFAQ